jgi:hypothetical protein
MPRWIALLVVGAVLLAGCAVERREAAQRRWEAQPIWHYALRTEVGFPNIRCEQEVEVLGERPGRVLSSSCARPSLWTVAALFDYIARLQSDAAGCARMVVGLGCVCRHAVEVAVEYDAALGYPRDIRATPIWRPNWQEQGYWRYAIQSRRLPDCTPPTVTSVRQLSVTSLRPLP